MKLYAIAVGTLELDLAFSAGQEQLTFEELYAYIATYPAMRF